MAPEGQTVIVLELPCYSDDAVWNMSSLETLQTEGMESITARQTNTARGGYSLSESINYHSHILYLKSDLKKTWRASLPILKHLRICT